ncbi:tetratricopeptide repeat protein [Soonwooa sp.]|uniref:tetratricopeptide repeat protein n=1 Tax=Soonwooa sp. TaxID=1938592 RepID=UPI002620B57E|nr:tetratricopeptide repeat protein [Soonwooa sp.]
MLKKNIIFLVALFSVTTILGQTKEEVYEKYLKKGAYNHSIYHPKYQQYIDSALAIRPNDAFLLQQKAMPLFKEKKYELGMQYMDKAVENDDKYDKYLSYRAFIKCIFQKNYKSAIQDFDLLISHYSTGIIMDHTFYFYRGLSKLQLNQLDAAEKDIQSSIDFSKANKFDPHYFELFYLGIIYLEKENYTKAMEYFDQSLKYYPKYSDSQFYKATCLYFLNKKQEAYNLLLTSKINFDNGDTITEDNKFYEEYPYQLKNWMLDGWIESLKKQI